MKNDTPESKAAQTKTGVVRSMTGFAAVRIQTEEGELAVSLRTVNHRGLDLHFHNTSEFAAFENEMRSLLKGSIARGHVEVRLALNRQRTEGGLAINAAAVEQYVAAFRQIANQLGLSSEPDLNALLSLRGAIREGPNADGPPAEFLAEVLRGLAACTEKLNEHREREGHQLRAAMAAEAAEIEAWSREISTIRQDAAPAFAARLRERLSEVLANASISEARLAEEAALLADRTDIQEEIVRLQIHTQELQKILIEGGELGKRLDFLLQEMNREANTMLAKSTNAGEPGLRLTALGLSVKANIERIREQALNLE